jgi:P4 family phage/plasmid primase-like protien
MSEYLNMIEFVELNDLKVVSVEVSFENNKKTISGIKSGWHKEEASELFKKLNKKEENILIRCNENFMILDTDEQPQYEYLVELLNEKGLFDHNSITPSFTNRVSKKTWKNHFWFRVDCSEFCGKDEVFIGTKQLNGWDILYGDNCQILECSNGIIGDTLQELTYENYIYIIKKMNEKFPKKSTNNKVVIKSKEKTEIKQEENNTEENQDIKILRTLLEGLNTSRFEMYSDWITIAMVFINEKLPIEIFHEYSEKISPEKFNLEANNKIIERLKFRPKGVKLPTLFMWLKEDNFKVFEELQAQRTDFWGLFVNQDKLQHSDYANIYFSLNPFKYIRSVISGWYEYDNFNVLHNCNEFPSSLLGDITRKLQKYILEQRNYLVPDMKHYDERMKICKMCYQQLGNSGFVKGIIDYLKDLYTDDDIDEKLNSNTKLIAFRNKCFDLNINDFRDIKPNDYITLTTKYDAPTGKINEEKKEYLLTTLRSWFDDDKMVEYLLLVIALATFNIKTESIYILVGKGGNGKSVLNDILNATFGDYFYTVDNTFLSTSFKNDAPRPQLFGSRYRRFLSIDEPETGTKDSRLNVEFVKSISGGKTLKCRTCHSKVSTEFNIDFSVFVSCNQTPSLTKFDKAMARRVKLFDFPYQFVDSPSSPFEKQRDYGLKERLTTEYREVFAQLIFEIAHKFITGDLKGNPSKINIPPQVLQATEEYLDSNNPVKEFLSEYCEITKNDKDRIKCSDLYNYFIQSGNHMSDKNFHYGMKSNDFPATKIGSHRFFVGLKYIVQKPDNKISNDPLNLLNED